MSTISRQNNNGVILSVVRVLFLLVALFLAACGDFHGPWDYYPEKRDVYTGIYTYGYIISGESPYVCFSKVYELDETAAESFAFYDSAYVTVSGSFADGKEDVDTTLVLRSYRPYSDKPNCFSGYGYHGKVGETYKLEAYFEWDSAGHKAKSRYTAEATIPNPVSVKGLNTPQQDGSYKWIPYNESMPRFEIDFLEFPMDMEFVKCAMDYDRTVKGVISVMNYDMTNAESQNTTINHMLKGFTSEDDEGYRGISLHDPLEQSQNLGFTSNRRVADYYALDTLYLMNMMLPLGDVSVDFYSTDAAYIDYIDKVKESVNDSRIVPESNIENGMGVFSGMAKSRVLLHVNGEGVNMKHIAHHNCYNTEGDLSDSWDSKGCRLYQDVFCAGIYAEQYWYEDLAELNSWAYERYRDTVSSRHLESCFASNVKAAMMLDTTKWSLFLPDTISEGAKFMAYSDGLKRYCVASNFENNKIADCYGLYQSCIVSPEANYCKDYLWTWCADRGWPNEEQCWSALVSRYYLTEQKSSIIKREVQEVCDRYHPVICDNWCEKQKDGHMKCQ